MNESETKATLSNHREKSMIKLTESITVKPVTHLTKNEDGYTYTVYYILSIENCKPGWSDTEEALGRWFCSTLYINDLAEWEDYSYPYALQSSGGWMCTGRVVGDWSKVSFYQEV